MGVGIDISDATGRLNTYIYFGPTGKDYVIENLDRDPIQPRAGGFRLDELVLLPAAR